MRATKELIRFLITRQFEDLPDNVIESSKRLIMDTVAVTIAGCRTELANIAINYINRIGEKEDCTIIGRGIKTSPVNAVFANTSFGHCLDFDDAMLDNTLLGHPSVIALPTALAIGELANFTGKDILLAYNLCLEVMGNLGRSVIQSLHVSR